jgi:peptidyl-prolyl cis-trans isomerase C
MSLKRINPLRNHPTVSPLPPISTPILEPIAAQVNNEVITLAELEAELARMQVAQTNPDNSPPMEELRQTVLDDLINQLLLAQGAFAASYTVDDPAVEARIAQLANQIGGQEALLSWMKEHLYTEEGFRTALRRAMAASWQRDRIMASVPQAVEQVHARQILVYDRESAERAKSRLVPGLDFATLVFKYDPITGGDLGWFPRGFLTVKEVEDVAFNLQPDEISEIVESPIGFHIIQVIERDSQHPLSPDALLTLQKQAVYQWLHDRRNESQITIIEP